MTRSEKLSDVKQMIDNLCNTVDSAEIAGLRLGIIQELEQCYDAGYFKLLSPTVEILLNDIERYSLQKLEGIDFPVDARAAGAAVDAICQSVLDSRVSFYSEDRERMVS